MKAFKCKKISLIRAILGREEKGEGGEGGMTLC